MARVLKSLSLCLLVALFLAQAVESRTSIHRHHKFEEPADQLAHKSEPADEAEKLAYYSTTGSTTTTTTKHNNPFFDVLIGVFMIVGGLILLWKNERRFVKTKERYGPYKLFACGGTLAQLVPPFTPQYI